MSSTDAARPGAAFGPEVYAARRERAAAHAREAGLTGLLVSPGPDLAYFTGYAPPETERLTLLTIPAEGTGTTGGASVVVPLLERGDLASAPGADGLDVVTWRDGDDEHDAAARLLAADGTYAVSDATWALHVLGLQRALPGASLTAFSDAVPTLRAVKDAAEVERLAAAGAAADAAFADVLGVAFAGRRERDVAADLDRFLREHGHEQVDFTLVCSGPNGADPHHDAGDRVIEPGDLVVLDFGGLRDGYGSDTSRTVLVAGGTDDALAGQQREVYDVVRRAQQAGVDAVRPGATCQDVDRAARAVIVDAGYGEQFVHRTGHGIGTTTHEPPYMVEGEDRPIEPGMCFSVEPGVYLPGRFGVRIEDIVVAFPPDVPDGARRLNTSTHDLQTVR
ncbi:aminopeptidase P family protein [Cellulosimicrobium funkei]|uniref:Aminopeptidase P family protein n=1 Tax=Cellulosimicrobium funkei TaxID=264251 RepID=A0A4Y8R158_9MICO|nr:aminopeptidase P family protein [Cellulosimicrobium funkei]TFF10432.1 aminopeptidase P family protein [Cellulosimicrobium funkei]TGA73675.1 aminopeptidase P family protein [Cellulosimicrobium terreum]